MSKPLKVIFAGTPDFAAKHLAVLLGSAHQVVGVFTQPDRPAGRGKKLMPSPVKALAEANGLPVFQPASLRNPEQQQLVADLNADVMIVVAYGLLLPAEVLVMPKYGCLNVHGSLLPAWRGAAPIQRALWAGDQVTGITIMQMDIGLDTGDMLLKVSCPIEPQDTSASLYDKLAELGPPALLDSLDHLAKEQLSPEKQENSLATYARKLTKDEARLDWNLSATALERCIRAFNPWPFSYLVVGEQNIKIWRASVLSTDAKSKPGTVLAADKTGIKVATSDGILNIETLQPPGKKPMSVQDLLNSRQEWFTPGTVLN